MSSKTADVHDVVLDQYPSSSTHAEAAGHPDDDKDNRDMGHTQQLHQQFKTRSLVGFTVTLGATWPYAIVSSPLSLTNGGPAGCMWSA
jgi:hypothetical protein